MIGISFGGGEGSGAGLSGLGGGLSRYVPTNYSTSLPSSPILNEDGLTPFQVAKLENTAIPIQMTNVSKKDIKRNAWIGKPASWESTWDDEAFSSQVSKAEKKIRVEELERAEEDQPRSVIIGGFAGGGIVGDTIDQGLGAAMGMVDPGQNQQQVDPAIGVGLSENPVGMGQPADFNDTDRDKTLSAEDEKLLQAAIMALDPRSGMPQEDIALILSQFEQVFGPGSVQHLQQVMQDEGRGIEGFEPINLEGPQSFEFNDGGQVGNRQFTNVGDGMSDSIPAMVDGGQPAALSSGEFVVPADVVSGAGNGSSEAGAQQLQGMVERIRSARTGQPEQPPAINPAGLMAG